MSKPVVFVIGASGSIGSATVSALSSKYQDIVEIRAGVRNPDKADHLKSLPGVSVVKATMGDEDLVNVFKGVDRLYIVTPTAENRAALTISTAESAKKAGLKHIAVVSGLAMKFPETLFGSQFSEVEDKVSSLGVPYTFIRLPFFVDNLLGFKDSVSQGAMYYFLNPDVKMYTVVVEDAGKAAATILVNPTKYVNQILTPCSDVHSYGEVAAELGKALGKEVKYIQVPIESAQKTMEGMGLPTWQAKGSVEIIEIMNEGKFFGGPTVYKEITGEKPTDLKTWVSKHANAFK